MCKEKYQVDNSVVQQKELLRNLHLYFVYWGLLKGLMTRDQWKNILIRLVHLHPNGISEGAPDSVTLHYLSAECLISRVYKDTG